MSNDYEITKLEIARLDIKDGDVLAVKILGSSPASMDDIEKIKVYISGLFPNAQAFIYSESQIELAVISRQARA
jgi:hypothetical protein